MLERVRCAPVLHHQLAHHRFRIGVMASDLCGGDDETQVTDFAFNRAEPAVTSRVKINFARAGSDACISRVHFEGEELCARSPLTGIELSGEDACASRGVD